MKCSRCDKILNDYNNTVEKGICDECFERDFHELEIELAFEGE